jgi:DNA-directed RNA polymerase sigma subunit (sigma70/sigma32)
MKRALDREEEAAMVIAAGKGEPAARAQLVEQFRGLIHRMAWKMACRGTPAEDLIGPGAMGILHAAETWEPARGHRFITLAWYWVRHYMGRAREGNFAIRLPQHAVDIYARVLKARGELEAEGDPEPTDEEVAARAECSVAQVRRLEGAALPLSLDYPIRNDEGGEELLAAMRRRARSRRGGDRRAGGGAAGRRGAAAEAARGGGAAAWPL